MQSVRHRRNGSIFVRATLMYGPGDVRVENVPDPTLQQPTDALVRVVRACVCGSDLHPYHSMPASAEGTPMGHEFIGVVEETGSDVSTVKAGDFVIAPFAYFDNTCEFCREGLTTSCLHGGFFRTAQAEAVRVPQADGTLVKARLGAEQIVLMGRHKTRIDLGREFGATDVVAERGEEGIAQVRELTGGHGTHTVLECVGHLPAYEQAFGVVRAGGVISRVGVPQYEHAPVGFGSLFGRNITLTGGPGAQRPYIEELLPDALEALKVLVQP